MQNYDTRCCFNVRSKADISQLNLPHGNLIYHTVKERIGAISAWLNGGEPGVGSKDERKHTGRNDLLFVEKMMWVDERV